MSSRTHGVTLVELIVVLAIMGVLVAFTALDLRVLRPTPADSVRAIVAGARRQAVLAGRGETRRIGDSLVRFLPDGRAIGTGVAPLTGVPEPGAPLH